MVLIASGVNAAICLGVKAAICPDVSNPKASEGIDDIDDGAIPFIVAGTNPVND
jgi:hypothetical protein